MNLACLHGNLDIVKWLYNNKLNDSSIHEAIDYAIINKHYNIIDWLQSQSDFY